MSCRKMSLPEGWYPHEKGRVEKIIETWDLKDEIKSDRYVSGIVPHAGWYFSGKEAWRIIRMIPEKTETIIIAGGHLSENSKAVCWNFDEYEVPGGHLKLDRTLFRNLCKSMPQDFTIDNTIEIQLPLLWYKNPKFKILAIRLPPNESSFEWGRKAAEITSEMGRETFFLGSTDLTHYGLNYENLLYRDYPDPLEEAYRKEKELLRLVADGRFSAALNFNKQWQTSCSLGAALGAAGFADFFGKIPGEIVSLTSSSELTGESESFVNYGTLLF